MFRLYFNSLSPLCPFIRSLVLPSPFFFPITCIQLPSPHSSHLTSLLHLSVITSVGVFSAKSPDLDKKIIFHCFHSVLIPIYPENLSQIHLVKHNLDHLTFAWNL